MRNDQLSVTTSPRSRARPTRTELELASDGSLMLLRIRTYHVVPDRVTSSDVAKLRSVKAVSGDTIQILPDEAS